MYAAVISIAILFGLGTTLDLVNTFKRGWAITRFIGVIICTSIPAMYRAMNFSSDIDEFSNIWLNYFYVTYLLSLIISIGGIYFFLCKPLINKVKRSNTDRVFSSFDLFLYGYKKFKEEVSIIMKECEDKKTKAEKRMLQQYNDYGNVLPKYIVQVFMTLFRDLDSRAYIVYVLKEFISNFMGQCDARFTVRRMNEANKMMESYITTKDDYPPGGIDVTKPNLISKSLEEKMPLIYSRNKEYHYATSHNSVVKGKYDDYVSYCLVDSLGKPVYSICLDVKGVQAVERMHSLVDSAFFLLICDAIKMKLKNEIDNKTI